MKRPPIIENDKFSRYVAGSIIDKYKEVKGILLVDEDKNLHIQFFAEGFPTIIMDKNKNLKLVYEGSEPHEVESRKKTVWWLLHETKKH
jgi:hypothetical protein